MATQTKKARTSECSSKSKAQQLLTKYRSTVFACDISGDTRYVRCDFPHCSQHGSNVHGVKPSWILNTLKNVKFLESHVGQEVYQFTKQQQLGYNLAEKKHYIESEKLIQSENLPDGVRKVLAVFSLNDPQSQFGDWVSFFLEAARIAKGIKSCDFVTITQNFISRMELMEAITKLGFLESFQPKVEVVVVLSTHSSSQGQVFSCTPLSISKESGFEEFCSLHDFIQACQDVVGEALTAIHISSCFTLKLDCSHADWPADASWLKNKLRCLLSGSVKEVYETGSQVADLHLMLSTLLEQDNHRSCARTLEDSVRYACIKSFPDLAREMGLVLLTGENMDSNLNTASKEEKVTHPGLVMSSMCVVILVEETQSSEISLATSLARAVATNLDMRKASDVRCDYIIVPVCCDKASHATTKKNIKEKLTDLSTNSSKVLFVVLGSSFSNPNLQLLDLIDIWGNCNGSRKVYGVHFQNISTMQAYHLKRKLKGCQSSELSEIDLSSNSGENQVSPGELASLAVTGLIDNKDEKPEASFPVLLYMIHLAVGENGNRLSGKGIPSAVYSNKPAGQGLSEWTFEEVYMETSHVLLGLSQECGLCLLSIPVAKKTNATFLPQSDNDDNEEEKESLGNNSLPSSEFIDKATGTQNENALTETKGSLQDETAFQTEVREMSPEAALSSVQPLSFKEVSVGCIMRDCQRDETWTDEGLNDTDETICNDNIQTNPGKMKSTGEEFKNAENSAAARTYCNSTSTDDENMFSKCGRSGENTTQFNLPITEEMAVCSEENVNCGNRISSYEVETHTHQEDVEYKNRAESFISNSSTDTDCNCLKLGKAEVCHNTDLVLQSDAKIDDSGSKNHSGFACLEKDQKDCQIRNCSCFSKDRLLEKGVLEPAPETNFDHTAEPSLALPFSRKRTLIHTEPAVNNKQQKISTNSESVSKNEKDKEKCLPMPPNTEILAGKRSFSSSSVSSVESKWDKSEDLPLMANVDEVLVEHYILDLKVNFEEQILSGCIVLFLKPTNKDVTKRQFQLCLDSTLVNIESVHEVSIPQDYRIRFLGSTVTASCNDVAMRPNQERALGQTISGLQEECGRISTVDNSTQSAFLKMLTDQSQNPLPYKGLKYSVHGWCVRIWKPGATGSEWPRCVWIKYRTSPEGQSLTWARDQDGRPCVFSPGAYINNRSLMPCQEPPVAMSTWQAAIRAPRGCTVLMSGNMVKLDFDSSSLRGQVTYHYEMRTPLPCSTLALAIGWFECRDGPGAKCLNAQGNFDFISCQVFAAPSLIDQAANQLLRCAPLYLQASCELIGPYPFSRLSLIILPRCFACMGLKSPNVVFLSQSILAEDCGMNVRVAHEITHAWFGLLIGAKDWTEEWLSEGFSTYLEERVQSRAEKWSAEKDRFMRELRMMLRYRTLSFEIGEVDENLQCLRPQKMKSPPVVSVSEAIERSDKEAESETEGTTPHTVVQFGQVCSKKWTQVYYLKGYFLLHHMGNMVGMETFDRFLFEYVQYYKGQLVTSEVFFDFFLEKFPDLSKNTKSKLIADWLECPGMPKDISVRKLASRDNKLVNEAIREFENWRRQDTTNKRNRSRRVRGRKQPQFDKLKVCEQVVLMLEKLLEKDSLCHTTLRQLNKCYDFAKCNAEIRHRWCELIVKHRFTPALEEVKRFLIEDQGMGIYLFGELMISQQPKQRALAQEVFKEIGPEMDRCTYQTVVDMLEGNSD